MKCENWSCSKFLQITRGIYYITVSLFLIGFSVVAYDWQEIWIGGFKDVNKVSEVLVDFMEVVKPVPDHMTDMKKTMVKMEAHMDKMSGNLTNVETHMGNMNLILTNMDKNVYALNSSVAHMARIVPWQMNKTGKDMKPWRMFNPMN